MADSNTTHMHINMLTADAELLKLFEKFNISDEKRSSYLNEDISQKHISKLLLSLWRPIDAPNSKCLVVGAGRGGLSSNLGVNGFIVDSLEPYLPYAEIIIWKYSRRGISGHVLNAQIESADLHTNQYDFTAMVDVIEHVEDPKKSLEIIFASLKNGGKLYVTVPARFQFIDPHYKLPFICWMPLPIADRLLSLLGRLKEDGGAGRQRLSTMHYYTFGDFKKLALSIGFEVVDVRRLQITNPESFTYEGDRFSKLAMIMKRIKASWMLAILGRIFIGHRFLLIKK